MSSGKTGERGQNRFELNVQNMQVRSSILFLECNESETKGYSELSSRDDKVLKLIKSVNLNVQKSVTKCMCMTK